MEIHEECNNLMNRLAGDSEFRARMCAEPAKALEEQGISAPSGTEIRVVENTAEVCHLVLPASPNTALSDASMEAVAGGTGINPADPAVVATLLLPLTVMSSMVAAAVPTA